MTSVNVRDLRNHGGDVLDRVSAGEEVTVLRAGVAVARLVPMPRRGPSAHELVRRRQSLTPVDPAELKRDVDSVIDMTIR